MKTKQIITLLIVLVQMSSQISIFLGSQKHSLSHKTQHRHKQQPPNQPEQYIICKLRSGKLGYVTELKQSENKDDPVTIINKKSYVELDRNIMKVYVDSTKQTERDQIKLKDMKRVIFPISFAQEDAQINCFQVETDPEYQGDLFSDYEVNEPLVKDNMKTFCFSSQEEMKKWELTLYAFRDDCLRNEHTSQLNNTLYLQKIEDHFEKELTNLVDIGKGLYEQFNKIELKNKEIETKVENLYKVNTTAVQNRRLKSVNSGQQNDQVDDKDSKDSKDSKGPQTPKIMDNTKTNEQTSSNSSSSQNTNTSEETNNKPDSNANTENSSNEQVSENGDSQNVDLGDVKSLLSKLQNQQDSGDTNEQNQQEINNLQGMLQKMLKDQQTDDKA